MSPHARPPELPRSVVSIPNLPRPAPRLTVTQLASNATRPQARHMNGSPRGYFGIGDGGVDRPARFAINLVRSM